MRIILIILLSIIFMAGLAYADNRCLSSSKNKPAISKSPNKPDPNVILQGGDTIEEATVIESLPYQDLGTTIGYTDDYDEVCPYEWSTSPDVVFSYVPPNDMFIHIYTCHSSDFDTKIYVYENEYTPGEPYACNDDYCPDWLSHLPHLYVTRGNTYYIVMDGYEGESGNYSLDVEIDSPPPPLPTCVGTDFQQPPHTPDDDWSFARSDAGTPEQCLVYENFYNQSEISALKFLGLDLSFNVGWYECFEDPIAFEINIYLDDNGMPGNELESHTVITNPTPTGQIDVGYEANEYYCILEPPITIDSGWISIQGVSDPQDCWFLWSSGTGGDSESYVWEGGPDIMPTGYDRSLCFYSRVSGINIEDQIPITPNLISAYPNPFNSTATIEYLVTNPGNVKISIYNQLGELVTVLLNESKQPGQYSVNWEASDYSSGVYFARMESLDFNKSVKFTLVK